MNESERVLVRLAATIAASDRSRLIPALEAAAPRATPAEIEEVLLQSYLFVGYPAVIRALQVWRERSALPPGTVTDEDAAGWLERGERVCALVYGGQYERLRENVSKLHPDLDRWMVVEGYGKVLGRPGLPLRTRELCIIAVLVAQDAPQQLYAHLRGAWNVGALPADIEAAIAIAAEEVGAERGAVALSTWRELKAKRERAAN